MKLNDDDIYTLSTGRKFYANNGILGICGNAIFEGYDGNLNDNFTEEEKREIAHFVIKQWENWTGIFCERVEAQNSMTSKEIGELNSQIWRPLSELECNDCIPQVLNSSKWIGPMLGYRLKGEWRNEKSSSKFTVQPTHYLLIPPFTDSGKDIKNLCLSQDPKDKKEDVIVKWNVQAEAIFRQAIQEFADKVVNKIIGDDWEVLSKDEARILEATIRLILRMAQEETK